MAPLIGRTAAALALVLFVPLASAQQPATAITVVATPAGSWSTDGYIDAGAEVARWALNATVTFSQSSFCPDQTKVHFKVFDADAKATGAATEPAEASVTVPAGGATKYATSQALFGLPATLPGLTPYSVRLQATVDKCANPAGTQIGAGTNATLTVTTLFRPGLDVQYTNRSADGTFDVTARNTGNGPMLVGVSVAPSAGAPTQPFTIPAPTTVAPGASGTMKVVFPEKKPGRYTFTAIGSFAGPNAEKQRRAEFSGVFEVSAPLVVTKTKSSPGAEVASVLALVVALVLARRR